MPRASTSCSSTTSCPTPTGWRSSERSRRPTPRRSSSCSPPTRASTWRWTAMKGGAYHYANKPFNLDEIALLVEKALETTRLRREVRALRATQAQPFGLDRIVGESRAITDAKAMLQRMAASPASTVLLTGESGTGKDLAAKVMHYASARAARPFMNITCSALPETLLESELFGHERGAFTDARIAEARPARVGRRRHGVPRRDRRDGAVAAGQAAALPRREDLQAGRRRRRHPRRRARDRRHQPHLEDEVKKGRFREDLYYRLNVLPIVLPPLRSRRGRHPAAGALLRRCLQRRVPEARARRQRRGDAPAEGLRLAGQRPRAAQRRRAGDAARRRRRADRRSLPGRRRRPARV